MDISQNTEETAGSAHPDRRGSADSSARADSDASSLGDDEGAGPAASHFGATASDLPWRSPSILIVGMGGIGGVLTSLFVEQGMRVGVVVRRRELARHLHDLGLELHTDGEVRRVRGELEIFSEPPATGSYDFVLLATPPTSVEQAARSVLPALAPHGSIVCLQNGLCEERVARVVGAERIIGTVIAWGASTPALGVFERTSSGGFVLGRLDGTVDESLHSLARVLEAVGPAEITANLRGARWSKLAINCAISALGTLSGERLGQMLKHRHARRLALEIMTEAVAVAQAEQVRLEKVSGTLDLGWVALTEAERRSRGSASLMAKHTLLLAVGSRFRRLRSSMLGQIERGEEPAIDYLNGELVSRGRTHGIAVPLNDLVCSRVRDVARRRVPASLDTLRQLYIDSRSIVPAVE